MACVSIPHLLQICHYAAGTRSEEDADQQGKDREKQVLALRSTLAPGKTEAVTCKAQSDSKTVIVALFLLDAATSPTLGDRGCSRNPVKAMPALLGPWLWLPSAHCLYL